MNVYCKKCGGLLAEDVPLVSPHVFAYRQGYKCKHCESTLSNSFNVIQEPQVVEVFQS